MTRRTTAPKAAPRRPVCFELLDEVLAARRVTCVHKATRRSRIQKLIRLRFGPAMPGQKNGGHQAIARLAGLRRRVAKDVNREKRTVRWQNLRHQMAEDHRPVRPRQ